MHIGTDGAITVHAANEPTGRAVTAGGYVALSGWVMGVDLSMSVGSLANASVSISARGGVTVMPFLNGGCNSTATGVLNASAQDGSLALMMEVAHAGGWEPFPSFSLATPPAEGRLTVDEHGVSFVFEVSTGHNVVLVADTVTLEAPSGSELLGPVLGVRVSQPVGGPAAYTPFMSARSCPKLDGSAHCADMSVTANTSESVLRGLSGLTFDLSGAYTGGDLHPLAGILPSSSEVAVIEANASSPINLDIRVDMATESVYVELRGGLVLHVSGIAAALPPIHITAVGQLSVSSGLAAAFVGECPAFTVAGGMFNVSDAYLALATSASLPPVLVGGKMQTLTPGVQIYWHGSSPIPQLCPGTLDMTLKVTLDEQLQLDVACAGLQLDVLMNTSTVMFTGDLLLSGGAASMPTLLLSGIEQEGDTRLWVSTSAPWTPLPTQLPGLV
eukprot:6754423-Prymnesium_polylepis.1